MGMRQMLASVLLVGFVAITAAAGTYAYFSDTEASAGNALTAGIFDLKLDDLQPADWLDGVTQTWTSSDFKPGDRVSGFVKLDNFGSVQGDHVDISADYSVTEETPRLESDTDWATDANPGSMAKQIVIASAFYYNDTSLIDLRTGVDILNPAPPKGEWRIDDVDGDLRLTINDLKLDPLTGLPPPTLPTGSNTPTFLLETMFDTGAGNEFQGDAFSLVVNFTLVQDASQ